MTIYGYDAAYPPDPATVAGLGGQLMAVYLTGNYAVPANQSARIHAAGMGALLNYEEAADELVHAGRIGGQGVGQRSLAAALRQGAPGNGTIGIFYSVDVSVDPSQFGAVGQAFDGINDVIRGKFVAHVYGEGALAEYLLATHRVANRQWLSASTSFPGYNAEAASIGLVQLVGTNIAGTDQNIITNAAGLDAWWPGEVPSSGGAAPISTGADDLTPEQSAKLDAIHARIGKIDMDDFALLKSILPAVSEMRPLVQSIAAADDALKTLTGPDGILARVTAIQVALRSLPAGSTVDAAVLHGAITAALGKLSATTTLAVAP